METKLKKELSNKNLIVKGRGSERTSASLKLIKKIMYNTEVEDIETNLRRSERNKDILLRRSDRIRSYSKSI